VLTTLIPQSGGVVAQRRGSLWASQEFVATEDDAAYGCVIDKSYTLWVAQRDGATQKGSKVTKGDWFVVETN